MHEASTKEFETRDVYIPTVVKDVLSKKIPSDEKEMIEFSQALYDQLKKRDLDIEPQLFLENKKFRSAQQRVQQLKAEKSSLETSKKRLEKRLEKYEIQRDYGKEILIEIVNGDAIHQTGGALEAF